MPLARYQIRNEFSLADPELYRAADKDDPEALLEGVAMAGLVGVLRQLGDLAQFAAEVFHGLHEEVMATAARGHGLMVRVQQLEAEVPSLEKAFLSQTHHSSFFSNAGIDWHPNLRSEQNLIIGEDLPRFVMDSYEDCRGPPRLFLLDKFDVAGAGACLKRYTDPSFFKLESASSKATSVEIHREKRSRRFKQKKAARLRNGETPEVVPTHSKLHQLLLEERVENSYSNPARLVKLKKRQLNRSGVDAENGRSYMEKFLESPSPDYKLVKETSMVPLPVKSMSEDTSEARIKVLEISTVSPVKRSLGNENALSYSNEPESELKSFSETRMETNGDLVKVHEQMLASATDEFSYNYKTPDETELADDEQKKLEACLDCYHSEDATSEVDNYVDALTTMESEMETDNESRPKNSFVNGRRLIDSEGKEHQLGAQFSISQSFGDSSISDESILFKQDRSDERNELQAQLSDSQSIGTSSTLEENSSFKRDTGEEHMNMHAQFSDSQSVGNSSASEEIAMNKKDTPCFSHIESFRMAEDIKSEPLSLSSTKYCAYEIENTHSDHLPESVESQKPDCHKFIMHDDAEFQEEEISDSGQTMAHSCLMHSAHLVSDAGVNSSVIQPPESQIIQTSDTVDLHSTSADTGIECLVEPNAIAVPDSVSTVMDDACSVSSERYPSRNLDDVNPCVQSEDSIQRSTDLELAPMIDSPATQLVEGLPDLGELHSSLADDEERKCHVDCIAAVPDALSTIKDGASPVPSSEEYPSNKLDESDPYVCCDASLPVSKDLELTPVIPTGTQLVETPSEPVEVEDDEERKCQIIAATSCTFSITKDDTFPGTSSKEYSLNLDNDEPFVHSDASQHISNDLNWASGDVCRDHSKIDILQDGLSNEDYDVSLAGKGVNSPQGHSPFMEVDLYSGAALPVDGAEVLDSKDLSCIIINRLDSQDLSPAVETPLASTLTSEQFSYVSHGTPMHKPDLAGVEALYSGQRSNSEETLRMDNDNDKNESTCSVDAVDDDGHLKQPYSPGFVGQGNCVNVHKVFTERVQSEDQAVSDNLLETFPVSSDSCQLKVESSEAESSEIFRDVNAETVKNKLEPSSGIVSSNIISSSLRDPSNLEESPASLSDPHVKEMLNEAVARESLTELEVQKVANQTEVASTDLGLRLNRAGSHDLSDSETSANDLSMVPEFSEPGTQELESSSCQNNSLPSPSNKQLVMETPVQLLQSEAGQQGVDFPLRVENSALEKFQSELHVSRQLGQERKSLAASEDAVEIPLDRPSSSDSVSQSDGRELNVAKHVMDPLKPLPDPILPRSDINLGEMPPMPPLPPMQWRKGKVQHASNKEVIEVSQASFQPIQTIKTDERGQFGSITSERETLQYQNTFLPLMAVEGDKIPYSSGFSVGSSGHPVAVPLKFPFMVNEANGQYNYVVLERSQMQNPFLTLPMVSTVKPSHGLVLASEGEMVQYSSLHPPMPPVECDSGQYPVSSQEKLAQTPSQLIEETTSEAKEPTHSVSNLEGEQEDPSMTSMPPPSMEMVQHNHGLRPSEGEMPLSLGHDPVSSHKKLAQPPSQLIEETTSEPKEPTYSVSNLEGEQEDPSVTPKPPSTGIVQHNHSLPPSEGKVASSLGHDPVSSQEKLAQPPSQLIEETTSEAKDPTYSVSHLEGEQEDPSVTLNPPPSMGVVQHNRSLPPSEGEMTSSLAIPTPTSIETEGEKPNGIPKYKLPRPRNPLIDAVAAHDKSKLRKVTERSRPETAPKIDERDSLLEQIRTKSFNLKPAAATRPSIGGPKTNLKVAAILEKANAIRQALAGSDDEDDDADSWSDS